MRTRGFQLYVRFSVGEDTREAQSTSRIRSQHLYLFDNPVSESFWNRTVLTTDLLKAEPLLPAFWKKVRNDIFHSPALLPVMVPPGGTMEAVEAELPVGHEVFGHTMDELLLHAWHDDSDLAPLFYQAGIRHKMNLPPAKAGGFPRSRGGVSCFIETTYPHMGKTDQSLPEETNSGRSLRRRTGLFQA